MLTMGPGPEQLDELLDARAKIRMLRKELTKRRIAVKEIKDKLETISTRFEDVLTEIEVRQGRLQFGEVNAKQEQAAAPASAQVRVKRPKRANGQPEARA